nr:YhjD/YihY/BrkB family envelope integrity protein [Halalkaliarchaeum desulfuricum]
MIRDVATVVQNEQVTFLAASVAYYAFVSLFPALLLLFALSTTFFGEQIAATFVGLVAGILTPEGEQIILEAIAGAEGRVGATVVGVVVLVWSTLKVFRGLDAAFVRVYGAEKTIGILDELLDAVLVATSIGLGAALMIVTAGVIAALDPGPLYGITSVLALPVVLAVVFFPLYYLLPYAEVTVREVLPGTAFAAVGWTLLQAGFQVYAAAAGQYQVYGFVGGILLIVTWLYFAAIVLLVGAAINAVLDGDSDHKGDGEQPDGESSPSRGVSRLRDTFFRRGGARRRPNGTTDRQLQQSPVREGARMADDDRDDGEPTGASDDPTSADSRDGVQGAPDVAAMQAELEELRARLEEFEGDVERRTVEKPELEAELKRYVRSRLRRGHARGWGPYLVLLYGVILTLGAFYYLSGGWAIAAMIVLFLSTLGLYVLFVLAGIGLNALDTPGKAIDYVRDRR